LRDKIAARVAKELINKTYVTLGLGIPFLTAKFIKPESQIELAVIIYFLIFFISKKMGC